MTSSTTIASASRFGKFALLAKLAEGQFSDLFLGRSQGAGGFEKLVLIKKIHQKYTEDPKIADIFRQETRISSIVEHPNVRNVYEIGCHQNHYYIALEYLEGISLVDLMKGRRQNQELSDTRLFIRLLSQACSGLEAAHTLQGIGHGIIHGDINPKSIFITANGSTKILGFDMVQVREALSKRHGFVRRTSAYLSPEEITTGSHDLRSDIFSLGIISWECFTGRRLFKHDTQGKTKQAILEGSIPSLQEIRPDISDALNDCVMRSLERDPLLRFQYAGEFGVALDLASRMEGPPLSPIRITTLLKESFSKSLERQQNFVRAARDGITNAAGKTTKPNEPNWDPATDACTRVAKAVKTIPERGYKKEESPGDVDENPFHSVTAHSDFTQHQLTPASYDTLSLILQEEQEQEQEHEQEQEQEQEDSELGSVIIKDEAATVPNAKVSSPIPALTPLALPASALALDAAPKTVEPSATDVRVTKNIKPPTPAVTKTEPIPSQESHASNTILFILIAGVLISIGLYSFLILTKSEHRNPDSNPRLASSHSQQDDKENSLHQPLLPVDAGPSTVQGKELPKEASTEANQIPSQEKAIKAPKKAHGFLTIRSTPKATLYIDGKKRGKTPKQKLKLRVGKHQIKLVSKGQGKRKRKKRIKTFKIKIIRNKTTRKKIKF